MPDRPLDETQTASALGVSVSTLKRLIETGEFPGPVYVTERTRVWLVDDVRSYLHLRARIGPGHAAKIKGGDDDA